MSSIITVLFTVVISVAITAGVMYSIGFETPDDTPAPEPEITYSQKQPSEILRGTNKIKEISSQKELTELLQASALFGVRFYGGPQINLAASSILFEEQNAMASSDAPRPAAKLQAGSDSYSSTNIQVQNVDEPDYIKNDGKHVYIVSENTLSIIDAYPAKEADLILRIALDVEDQYIQNMFLNGDRLVIFYNGQSDREIISEYDFVPRQSYDPLTHALIIDVSDKRDPVILKDYSIDGRFMDARMIGDYAYLVTSSRVDQQNPRFPEIALDSVPLMRPDAFYFDSPEEFSNFNTLSAIDIFGDTVNSDTFLMGYTGTFYVSEDNFYLTYQQYPPSRYDKDASRDRFFGVIVPLLPSDIRDGIESVQNDYEPGSDQEWSEISKIMQDSYDGMDAGDRDALFEKIKEALIRHDAKINKDAAKTIIHKIAIDGERIDHVAEGTVSGRLLNQFSMDESADRFRVATTTEYYTEFEGTVRSNAVYVLDENLDVVGGLDNIAPDERIYSARFIDDRLYMVTFQQIDPFFVIDLSSDTPKILGELKIPGFSNYLHPYDEEHIIGIGRDTAEVGDRVKQLGVKIALFNVRDVANPMVADEIIIGTGSTHSEALYNHKAFFFDKTRGLLSIPITGDAGDLGAISKRISPEHDPWNGFYVLDLDDKTGFELKGTVQHSVENYYPMGGARTFYIDDTIYTASGDYLKMNSFENLEEINSIRLGNTGKFIKYLEPPR